MKLIEQYCEWVQLPILPLQIIERAGRTCYKSEDKITSDSSEKFVKMINKRGHESVIEHVSASMKFVTNRGVTHELVRHRLCAFSQESTRYVNYGGDDIIFIKPVWSDAPIGVYKSSTSRINSPADYRFISACIESEAAYKSLLAKNWRPEQAREVLPNALKTEIVVTANMRQWKHIFKLRTAKAAHPQIRELMLEALEMFRNEITVLFDNIGD
jgi:thymidylate synthase (FAD)